MLSDGVFKILLQILPFYEGKLFGQLIYLPLVYKYNQGRTPKLISVKFPYLAFKGNTNKKKT